MLPDEVIAVDVVASPSLPKRLAILTKAATVAVVRATRGSVAFIGS